MRLPSYAALIATAALYAVPRVMQHINTNGLPQSVRNFLSSDQVQLLGTIVKDNLWISFFAFQYLGEIHSRTLLSLSLSNLEVACPGLLASCFVLHAVRGLTARYFPSTAPYIGPSAYPM